MSSPLRVQVTSGQVGVMASEVPLERLLQLLDSGDAAAVTSLLTEAKLHPDAELDEDGCTPLLLAAARDRPRVVARLLEAGASPNKADTATGSTPLLEAARAGSTESVLLLVEAGADPELRDCDHWSPALVCCYLGHAAALRCLLEAGADTRGGGKTQCSGLAWAAGRGHGDTGQMGLFIGQCSL